jgi:hypothetical protein
MVRIYLALGLLIVAAISACGGQSTPTVVGTPTPQPGAGSWGLFVLVPPGEASSGVPRFGPDALRTGDLSGPDSAARARSEASLFVDLPKEAYVALTAADFEVQGASASQDDTGRFESWVLVGRELPRPAMVELRAYTPTGPVTITVFPGSPVHTTETSFLVNGNPTVTKFRTPMTDPDADQSVMWSQGSSVYILHASGPFADDDLLAWARAISAGR